MHVDIAIGTIRGAKPTSDTKIRNRDFMRIAIAMDRIHRTANKAVWIHTGATTASHEEAVKSHTRPELTESPRHVYLRRPLCIRHIACIDLDRGLIGSLLCKVPGLGSPYYPRHLGF